MWLNNYLGCAVPVHGLGWAVLVTGFRGLDSKNLAYNPPTNFTIRAALDRVLRAHPTRSKRRTELDGLNWPAWLAISITHYVR